MKQQACETLCMANKWKLETGEPQNCEITQDQN